MTRIATAFILTLAVVPALTGVARAQDAEAGKTVFKQVCSICHEVAPGKNRTGPTLFEIVGRKTATVAGYSYSDANKAANLTWDAATLNRYLADPKGVIPGTKMAYAGVKDDKKRADLIAYLATLH